MMTITMQILSGSRALDFDDPDRPVSSRSRWSDLTWRLDTDDAGYSVDGIPVRWWPGRPEGELPSPAEAAIMEHMKRLAWLGLFHADLTFVRKATGMTSVAFQCCCLARFMVERSIPDFSHLTPEAVDEYVSWTAADMAGDDAAPDGEAKVRRVAFNRLLPLVFVWKAKRHLENAGVPVPALDPLSGRSALEAAKDICDWVLESLPPIPEEPFARIVNAAADIVLHHSADVLRAQEIWLAHTGTGGTELTRTRAKQALSRLEFESRGSTATPWPANLLSSPADPTGCSPSSGLRRMIHTVRDACVIVLLATAGLRIREVVAIPGGRTQGTATPDSVSTETSDDGLLEFFTVTSSLTKGQVVPLASSWLIGSRPNGVGPLPLAAQALCVLETLMAPWRALATDIEARAALMVRLPRSGMPRAGSRIDRLTVTALVPSLHEFYRSYARLEDLPDRSRDSAGTDLRPIRESRGRCITVRQYRKNFAQYLLRIDSGLLPAIRVQLHHMRISTTQVSYTGNDPQRLGGLDDEQRLSSNRAIAAILGVERGTGGRLADLITGHERDLLKVDETGISDLLGNTGLALIPGEHGWCGIAFAPHLSRCNAKSGRANFLNTSFDPVHRNPTTCAGCKVFAFDASHRPFWQSRFDVNEAIWNEARARGMQDDYRVAEARAKQAAAFLKQIDEEKGR